MFTFLHRILVYGYNGKSSSTRGRAQKGVVKGLKQSQSFLSTICTKSPAPAAFVNTKVSKLRSIEHLQVPNKKINPNYQKTAALPGDESESLKLLQELLNVDPNVQERQLDICKLTDDYQEEYINRPYLYLSEIQDANEKLYFTLLGQYIEQYLPIIKTPTVTTTCKNFGVVYKKPKGLFINIHDKGQVYDLLEKWPNNNIRAVIVTESGRVLGQEDPTDRSPFGMGIPMSKLALYTALAGIKPNQCLPVTLDVGTDSMTLLEDPAYIGIKQRRIRGKEYNEFIDEFMDACVERFGPNTIVFSTSARLDNQSKVNL